MKYRELTLGQIEAIVNKLGGMEGVRHFLSGELAIKFQLRVWQTIHLGGFNTAEDFRHALSDSGCEASNWADSMMSQPQFAQSLVGVDRGQEYDLVLLTTAQLIGEKRGGTITEVFAGAARLGLKKCPAWVGPQLRLQYKDQPSGEYILVGMEPIAGSDGGLDMFVLERRASALWLRGRWDSPAFVWRPDDQWVFLRLRK